MTHAGSHLFAPLLLAGALTLTAACAPAANTPGATGAATAAPTAQAMATAIAPTAQAAATAMAPTAQALASSAVPTAQALASAAVPTAQALATQAAPQLQAAQETAVAASPITIEGARLDLMDSTMTVRNKSNQVVDLSNHQIRVGTTSVPMPANSRVQPGGTLTIHTAAGAGDAANVYLGDEARALIAALRPGVTIALIRDDGQRAAEFTIPG